MCRSKGKTGVNVRRSRVRALPFQGQDQDAMLLTGFERSEIGVILGPTIGMVPFERFRHPLGQLPSRDPGAVVNDLLDRLNPLCGNALAQKGERFEGFGIEWHERVSTHDVFEDRILTCFKE